MLGRLACCYWRLESDDSVIGSRCARVSWGFLFSNGSGYWSPRRHPATLWGAGTTIGVLLFKEGGSEDSLELSVAMDVGSGERLPFQGPRRVARACPRCPEDRKGLARSRSRS